MIGLVVGGLASGVGKTTLTLGLIGALRRRGLTVQPFKVGPDYIDPSQHAQVAGRPSRNLDSWQVPEAGVQELFARAVASADAAVVEGVMGLFDGRTGAGEIGSTAHVAKLLRLPVLLVIDAAKAARSVAASVVGCLALDPALNLVGVVLNNVASARHAEIGREAIESMASVPVLGWLPRNADLRQEERYLGLVPAAERRLPAELVERATALVEQQIDVERLVQLAAVPRPSPGPAGLFPAEPMPARTRIAVARDEAFSFYYQDSLDLLTAWGAELVPFSPLRDSALPAEIGGVYLGGGFPELHAIDLTVNTSMLDSLRLAARAGLRIYAECGGLMYLQDALIDVEGRRHRMAGLVPGMSTLVGKRLTLGYREVRALRDTSLTTRGQRLRGHEFHWSVCEPPTGEHATYEFEDGSGRIEGYALGNVLASYIHLHFASDPTLAPRFVASCSGDRTLAPPGEPLTPRPPLPRAGAGEPRTGRLGSGVERPETWRPAPTGSAVGAGFQVPHGATDHPKLPRPSQCAPDDANLSAGPSSIGVGDGAGGEGFPGPLLRQHGLPPAEIEALSRQRIDAQLGERLPQSEPQRSLVARLVYAAGDPDLAEQVAMRGEPIQVATAALARGARLVVDVGMVAAGIGRPLLAALGVEMQVTLRAEGVETMAARHGITRSAAGILALADILDGAVVAIGNAPTALLALLDLVQQGRVRPAAVIGMPVGFVAAEESKELLLAADVPSIVVRGTRGGSPLAAATVNHLLRLAFEAREGAGTQDPRSAGLHAP